jgi:hypothetical protein
VIPGVHDAALDVALQTEPMWEVPGADAQFEPLQQRFGCEVPCGVHVRPGAQLPVVSHRQPWVPTMHVEETPPEERPPPAPELAPELPPELNPKPDPELAPELAPELPPTPLDPPLEPGCPPPPDPPGLVDDGLPHAAITAEANSETPTTALPEKKIRPSVA